MSIKRHSVSDLNDEFVMRRLLADPAVSVGLGFFSSLAGSIAELLGVQSAWVSIPAGEETLCTLGASHLGEKIPNFSYASGGSLCMDLMLYGDLRRIEVDPSTLPEQARHRLVANAGCLLEVPLVDAGGDVLGVLAVADPDTIVLDTNLRFCLDLAAERATAELRRLALLRIAEDSSRQLEQLIDNAMDAIIQTDADLQVLVANRGAEKLFHSDQIIGHPIGAFLTLRGMQKLRALIADVDAARYSSHSFWIPGGLQVRPADGAESQVEATLVCGRVAEANRYTLILRSLSSTLQANRQLRSKTSECAYLRAALRQTRRVDAASGDSPAIRAVLDAIALAAVGDDEVLFYGEHGTGKSQFAEMIHCAGNHADRPFVHLRCAEVEPGQFRQAFFGANAGHGLVDVPPEGFVAAAQGGTLFLDAVESLNADMQAALLLMLESRTYMPVDANRGRDLRCRIIASTGTDLAQRIARGKFDGKLGERLASVQIEIPALRSRREDIAALAGDALLRCRRRWLFADGANANVENDVTETLSGYDWPGNLPELCHAMEEEVLLSLRAGLSAPVTSQARIRVGAIHDLDELGRAAIIATLERCDWRIGGARGAAAHLGVSPGALSARLKELGITQSK